jgi:hypothetical protein
MTGEPDANANPVFWIVDKSSTGGFVSLAPRVHRPGNIAITA